MSGLRLEDFLSHAPEPEEPQITPDMLQSASAESFDAGYKSGWDDGTRSAAEEGDARVAALRTRLQDLDFTFHEARAAALDSLLPLLHAIAAEAVPKILHDTMGHRIAAVWAEMAEDSLPEAPELRVHPDECDAAELLIRDIEGCRLRIVGCPDLSPGLLQVRLGDRHREIDRDRLAARLTDALTALSELNEDIISHG